MNFQVTEQNNKNLKTSKLNRCIAFTSLSPSSTTTPPPTTTLTASLRSFSLLSLNFQIQGTLFPVLSIRISTCTTSVAAWSVLTLIHNFHLFFLFFLEGVWFFLLGQWENVGKEKKIVFFVVIVQKDCILTIFLAAQMSYLICTVRCWIAMRWICVLAFDFVVFVYICVCGFEET